MGIDPPAAARSAARSARSARSPSRSCRSSASGLPATAGTSPPTALSYANRRRLEIARALATRPKLLLLDEPAAGMNPNETREVTELIGRLRDELGIAILVIEHDMHVVAGCSDRVVALDHGVKIAEGTLRRGRQPPGGRRGLPGPRPRGAGGGVMDQALLHARRRHHLLRARCGSSRGSRCASAPASWCACSAATPRASRRRSRRSSVSSGRGRAGCCSTART